MHYQPINRTCVSDVLIHPNPTLFAVVGIRADGFVAMQSPTTQNTPEHTLMNNDFTFGSCANHLTTFLFRFVATNRGER